MTQRHEVSTLCVEDDETTRVVLASCLSRLVREVHTAADGSEGLQRYLDVRPDIVVTDVRMPVMDGLRMATAILQVDQDALIIVTTAHSDLDVILDAIEIGVERYLIKPVTLAQLARAIDRCAGVIERRRLAAKHLAEQQRLVVELQAALDKVRQLSGMLPLCAACRKVRDDRGYWQQIEEYVRNNSDAQFTHGICPECVQRLYPGYDHEDADAGGKGEGR